MTNTERIAAYFNNELNEADKEQLLKDIESDASLKSDYQFQQNVIDGIKAYRKQELIARLDQVQIASTGSSLLVKTIGILGIATIATIGTYLWLAKPPANETPIIGTTVTEPVDQQIIEPEAITNKIDTEQIPVEEDKKITSANTNKPQVDKIEEKVPAKAIKPNVPNVAIPEVMEPSATVNGTNDEDLVVPDAMRSSDITLTSSTHVEVQFSKKYNFHYQVKDGNLFLYGDFKDAPFEVLEMNTNLGIKTYLYYNSNFYGLNSENEEIKPLKAIENKQLIEELKKRR